MDVAVRAARLGNRILGLVAMLIIVLMLSYGGYSLWDNYMVSAGAFLSGDLLKYKPQAGSDNSLTMEELLAVNEDVRGWITIDDTMIDYPVVQGETDMAYINTDVMGEFSLAGSIFLSCLNKPDFSDHYNLLYGHNVDTGGMFSDVIEFKAEHFFDTHETGTLFLTHQTYAIELFACVEADAYDSTIYSVGEGADMGSLLSHIESLAVQYREIGVTPEDQIIGMSTCADAQSNDRVILFGRLVEK